MVFKQFIEDLYSNVH